MKMVEVLERAKRQLADTTGLKAVAVTRALRDDEGWHVGLEMLEMPRIPPATDVLGAYDVHLAQDGTLLRFERTGRRLRGDTLEEDRT